MDYYADYFLNKFPFVKFGKKGGQKVVFLPPTGDLIWSLENSPELIARTYEGMGFSSDDYECYVLGYDPKWPDDYSFEDLINDFDKILKEEIGPATLVGISFGGFLAVPLAQRNPDLVKKMAMIISGCRVSEEGRLLAAKMVKSAQEESQQEFLNKVFLLFRRRWANFLTRLIINNFSKKTEKFNPVSTFINAYSSFNDYGDKNKELLKDVKAKTLIVGAEHDQFFSKEIYQETAKLIPNAKLEFFKDETHMVVIEKSLKVRKMIKEFMSS